MKLYFFETPNPRKPCAVARYLGSPVEFVRVDLAKGEHKRPEFLAINPNGKVPALEDGATRLWEATAIMCYLADKAGSSLWPEDARRIDIIRWFSWDTAHLSRHAGTLYFQNFVKRRLRLGDPDPAAIEEATGYFKQFAGVLNDHLQGRHYLVGDSLTLADFAVSAFLADAEESRLPLDEFAEVRRWMGRLEEIPAWREPFPAAVSAAA